MSFVKILPRDRTRDGLIKVSFTGYKTQYANVYLDKELLNMLQWPHSCRVYVYFDDENPLIWKFEQAEERDRYSFKITDTKYGKSRISKLQFKAPDIKIAKEHKQIKTVSFTISDDKKALFVDLGVINK